MPNLIQRLNLAIDAEYDSKNEEVDELLKLSIEERVVKGDTISNITANFIDANTNIPITNSNGDIIFKNVIIKCNDNISKFREGSPVILSGHGLTFSLAVLEDKGETMILEDDYQFHSIPSYLNNKSGWQLDNAKVDIRNTVKKSTAILTNDPVKYNFINGIFEGSIRPKISPDQLKRGKQLAEQTKLNTAQKEGFAYAYATENYFLIQGPPGSGKTWLLAHLAHQFANEGKKVLITAFTHTAINNALQKISSLTGYPHIVKVGKKNQTENLNSNGSTAKNFADFSRSGYNNESKGIIVGATCYSPFTRKLEFMDWDIVIIDEAGQLNIPLAIAAMVKGKKYILIGDHKQLPPIVSDKHNDIEFTKSIFEHLFQFTKGIMLNITYRMNKYINDFPSKQFYGGKLKPHPDNENWILDIPNDFSKYQEILDINKPEVLFCHLHSSFYSRSEFEADIIAEFVNEYLKTGIKACDIAIITPFRAQVRQIKKALSNYDFYERIKDVLFIDTIERIQGQERNIIIFSLATSDPEKAKQRADFFFNPNRFNVALTRAKKKRIVVANKNIFELETKDKILKPLIKNFKDFYAVANIVIENTETEDIF